MAFHLYRMTLQGKVAMINLALVGFGILIYSAYMREWLPPSRVAEQTTVLALFALSFPVGWLCVPIEMLSPVLDKLTLVFSLCFLLPANAYLWGYVIAAISRWRLNRAYKQVEGG